MEQSFLGIAENWKPDSSSGNRAWHLSLDAWVLGLVPGLDSKAAAWAACLGWIQEKCTNQKPDSGSGSNGAEQTILLEAGFLRWKGWMPGS